MSKRVLITGGAGFIGSHTADLLAKSGYSIRILDNLEPPVHSYKWPKYVEKKGYELIKGDVRNREVLLNALKDVDYVIHLAAHQDQLPDFSKFFEVNTVSTALLYELIVANKLPVKKILYASSQFIYGDGIYKSNSGGFFSPELRTESQFGKKQWDILDSKGKKAAFMPFKEDQNPNPTNSYGLSKIASERLAIRLGKTYNIPTAIVRYSIVQGPRQSPRNIYSGALRIFVMQALAGSPITVYEDGNQLRDFANVEDIAMANKMILEDSRTNYEIFNAGGGTGYKVIDFANMVKRITNSPSEILVNSAYRKTDTRNAVSDISKLKALGWIPQHNPEKAIREYSAWIKEESFDVKGIVKDSQKELQKMGVVGKAED